MEIIDFTRKLIKLSPFLLYAAIWMLHSSFSFFIFFMIWILENPPPRLGSSLEIIILWVWFLTPFPLSYIWFVFSSLKWVFRFWFRFWVWFPFVYVIFLFLDWQFWILGILALDFLFFNCYFDVFYPFRLITGFTVFAYLIWIHSVFFYRIISFLVIWGSG